MRLFAASDSDDDFDEYDPSPVVPTRQAAEDYQRASDTFFDDCLAAESRGDQSCRLLLKYDSYFKTDTDVYMPAEVKERTWTVVRRPEVKLAGRHPSVGSGLDGFGGEVAVPGEVKLTAVGTDDGKRTRFTTTCLVIGTGLAAGLTEDGALATQWSPIYSQLDLHDDLWWIPLDCFRGVTG